MRGRLSLEGRDTFAPVALPDSVLATEGRVEVRGAGWDWEWVRRAYPLGPLVTEPHAGRDAGPMTLAWLVPNWKVGSGGHTTIFRLIAELEARGHRSAIHVWDPFEQDKRPAHELREEIRTRFVPLEAPVFRSLERWRPVDIAVATNWWTAWPLRDLPGAREKAYLVQDHEPEFEATSAPRLWAEETYRMGYRHLAYTRWMADLLGERYGAEAEFFDCGTDLGTYTFGDAAEREPGLVAVYARQETERRAVELAMAGVATLDGAPPRHADRPLRGQRQARLPRAVREPRRPAAGRAGPALPPRERGRRALPDDPLARGPGDDGRGPAGGGARRRERHLGARRERRARAARPAPARRAGRRARLAPRRPGGAPPRWRGGRGRGWRAAPGPARATRPRPRFRSFLASPTRRS